MSETLDSPCQHSQTVWEAGMWEGPIFKSHTEKDIVGLQRFLGGASGKELACQCRRPTRCGFDLLVQEDPLEEGMATHSSILAWRIPWTEEPGRLQSMWSQRVGPNYSDLACTHTGFKETWKPELKVHTALLALIAARPAWPVSFSHLIADQVFLFSRLHDKKTRFPQLFLSSHEPPSLTLSFPVPDSSGKGVHWAW